MGADFDRRSGASRPFVVSSVHMAVRDQLRNDILVGAFPGGTRLQQSELASHYRVSVTPIREALRDLASEGLVDFGPFSGAVVHSATIPELRHIYEIRSQLYSLAVPSAITNISKDELEEAEHLVEEMARTPSPELWVMHNRRLHRVLDGAVENTFLADILHRLADVSALYVHISDRGDGRRPMAHEEHVELLAAYRRRDAEEATRLTVAHIRHTLDYASRLMRAGNGEASDNSGDAR